MQVLRCLADGGRGWAVQDDSGDVQKGGSGEVHDTTEGPHMGHSGTRDPPLCPPHNPHKIGRDGSCPSPRTPSSRHRPGQACLPVGNGPKTFTGTRFFLREGTMPTTTRGAAKDPKDPSAVAPDGAPEHSAPADVVIEGTSSAQRSSTTSLASPRGFGGAHEQRGEVIRLQSSRPRRRHLCRGVLGRGRPRRRHRVGPYGGPHAVLFHRGILEGKHPEVRVFF